MYNCINKLHRCTSCKAEIDWYLQLNTSTDKFGMWKCNKWDKHESDCSKPVQKRRSNMHNYKIDVCYIYIYIYKTKFIRLV